MRKIIILSSALLLISFSANAQISITFGEPESYPPHVYSPYYVEYAHRYPSGHRHDRDWEYWAQERRDQEERDHRKQNSHDNGNHGEGNRGNDKHGDR